MTAADWARGYGAIRHTPATRARIAALARSLPRGRARGDGVPLYALLHAMDRVASAGMWLVVHETYARRVYLDGRPLAAADFKPDPQGHTGGALNMVPAYVGYLGANALAGITRAWLMGQGHCVAAIDSVNLLVGNTTRAHAARYAVTDAGLTRYVRDFYSYRLDAHGLVDSPLGSHVNAYTAGGLAEGGYLGFAELTWVHMPLRGERLVTFLSDGAFEEQRGSDWAPRWWRAEDSGLVAPIMINNGRRIDQRTTMAQEGGTRWLASHLHLNGFDPIVFDGRDPAAFLWAIVEIERRLEAAALAVRRGRARYPVPLPYGIAVAPKGAGFPGEGTNLAHNLPLPANPSRDEAAARTFNSGARRLHVPIGELRTAAAALTRHAVSRRPRERDHALARRSVSLRATPRPAFAAVERATRGTGAASPMAAVDRAFAATVRANPQLRPRVGNPDEMKSNRLTETLELLRFRVTEPEPGIPEAVQGAVITALNEEAVTCAALGNTGGINLIHTYEAFGAKMYGALRQEVIFSGQLAETGRPSGRLSIPVLLTSHTWENGKNQQSHQDPSLSEAMLGELGPASRVLFPADANTATAVMDAVYRTRGQIWTVVAAKGELPHWFSGVEARRLLADGGLRLRWAEHQAARASLALVAIGGYQLAEVLRASRRLRDRGVSHAIVYLLEPGRFRAPRTEAERRIQASPRTRTALLPPTIRRVVLLSHTRPEPMRGALELRPDIAVSALGYTGRGGTLDTPGMLFVNRATWAHVLAECARLLGRQRAALLDGPEIAALDGRATPHGAIIPARADGAGGAEAGVRASPARA